jgi:ATP-dependent DNA ligase
MSLPYIYPNLPNWLDPKDISQFDRKPEWIAERKKNGWRCLAVRSDSGLILWTRRHTIIPDPLPLTREALMNLEIGSIVDGELMEKRTKDIKDLYYAFDILYEGGKALMGMAWKDRRNRLEKVMGSLANTEISMPVTLGKSLLYNMAIEEGDEGIVMKEIHSKYIIDYKSCPSNPFWIKCKKPENCMKTKEA